MDIELAQALEENAKLKELLQQFIPYRQIINSVAFKDLAEQAEQLLSALGIEPDDRFEVTENGKKYLQSLGND